MVRVSPEMKDLLLKERAKRGNKHLTDTSREVAKEFSYYKQRDEVLKEEIEKVKKLTGDFRIFR